MTAPKELVINLDEIQITKTAGVALVRLDFVQDGKHVHVHIDLYQHELRASPTLRMTAVNRTKDVTKVLQVRPWSTPST